MLKGSNLDLYTFGQLTIPENKYIAAFKQDRSISYSNEMQLSVSLNYAI